MHRFRVKVGDGAKLLDLGFAFINAGTGVSPSRHVCLHETGFRRRADNRVHIGDRSVGCHRAGVDLVVGDRIRDEPADGIIGAGGSARPDPEELGLRARRTAEHESGKASCACKRLSAGKDHGHFS